MTGPSPDPSEPLDAEIVEPAPQQPPAPDYDERGAPTLDYVRDKIESRYATALGNTELTEDMPQAQTLDQQQQQREQAAAAKLDEIRRQLNE